MWQHAVYRADHTTLQISHVPTHVRAHANIHSKEIDTQCVAGLAGHITVIQRLNAEHYVYRLRAD